MEISERESSDLGTGTRFRSVAVFSWCVLETTHPYLTSDKGTKYVTAAAPNVLRMIRLYSNENVPGTRREVRDRVSQVPPTCQTVAGQNCRRSSFLYSSCAL